MTANPEITFVHSNLEKQLKDFHPIKVHSVPSGNRALRPPWSGTPKPRHNFTVG